IDHLGVVALEQRIEGDRPLRLLGPLQGPRHHGRYFPAWSRRKTPDWQDGQMRRLLLLASTVVFLDVVFYTAITPLLPGYVDDLGLSKAAAGVLSASYAAGTLLASLPAGFVAARAGPRPALLSGLLLLGLASLAFGFGNAV